MDHKEQLQQALDEIPHLRGLSVVSPEYISWKARVTRLLNEAYGDDSAESRRFANAAGTTFRVGTPTGRQQDYDWQLDCYADVLKSLIPKEKMF
ncbi:MAG: hypothetical protein ABIH70_09135 [Chloroflexota bacterium]